MRHWLIITFARPWISLELPGWGKVYRAFVGSYEHNDFWKDAAPRIIRDKRCGLYRLVNIKEWADRVFFFLRRWYDLETALVVDALVKPGNRVLDIGANYGHFAMAAALAVGDSGEVIAVEPNPRAFCRLSIHIELNQLLQVRAEPVGFSDREGALELSVPAINAGEATFGRSKYQDDRKIVCPVYKVDDYLKDRQIDFIKIDVEGYECHVLRGSIETLKRFRPLVLTEIIDQHLLDAGETREGLVQQFDDLSYTPFRLGLKRRGFGHLLKLSRTDAKSNDGDYLWVPAHRVAEIESLLQPVDTIS